MLNDEMEPSCMNCISEYVCKWKKEMLCEDWRPDLDWKKMAAKAAGFTVKDEYKEGSNESDV